MYAWRKCTLFCVKKVCGMFAGLRKISTFASAIAEIAQLVEHNLAKVRVASSSLVFRSEKKEAESFDSASFFLFTVYRCFKITVRDNSSIPATAQSDGGMLLKYDDTENRTYLRFTGYPPLIIQLNNIGKEGYINAIDTKSVLKVSPSNNQIEVAAFEDYDAHTTRCVQE